MAADRSALPRLGSDPAFQFPAIAKASLPNGLRIWTVAHRGLPVTSVLLLIEVGASADPPERPGLAALTADLLDEGSGELSALQVHDALARIGAQFDVEVGPDATLVSLTTMSRFVDRALELLADMVLRPQLDPDEFARVRQLRLNRLTQLRDVPSAVADIAFARVLYGDHPYGHLPIGTETSIHAVTLDEVRTFHQSTYRPARATLIAVGDISANEMLAAASARFAEWPLANATPHTGPNGNGAPPAAPASRLTLVHRPGAAQSELRIGQVAVPRRTPDYYALLVLNTILGGQFVSRINMNLREEKGYTYGARTTFDFRLGRGPFVLQTSVQVDATAAAVAEVTAEIGAIRGSRPVTDEELALARAALTRGYPRSFETAPQIARGLGQLALYGLPDDYFARFVPSVAAVDVDAVTTAAVRHLDPQQLVAVVVSDRDKVLSLFEATEVTEITDQEQHTEAQRQRERTESGVQEGRPT
jgi:zinc protease